MQGGERLNVTAHAKLTLNLRVTGVRDDGYHLIDAEMVTLDLADTLTFTDGSGVVFYGAEVGDEVEPIRTDQRIQTASTEFADLGLQLVDLARGEHGEQEPAIHTLRCWVW